MGCVDCKDPVSTREMPTGLSVRDDAIPAELRERPQWVLWRLEHRDSKPKPTKVPLTITGRNACTTDAGTWTSFDDVRRAYEAGVGDGIGFVFTADDPYTGIDLDSCRDPETGALEPWAQAIVDRLASYAEISPSGRGVHVIVRGKLPSGARRKGKVEAYDSARYFAMTGWPLNGRPAAIEERGAELQRFHAEVLEKRQQLSPSATASRQTDCDLSDLSDDQLLAKAVAAKDGDKFEQLWRGEWAGAYVSQSEADLALCSLLAFWLANDAGRIDHAFRKSGLMRPKWDERHGECTYGEITIGKVLAAPRDTYGARKPDGHRRHRARSGQAAAGPAPDLTDMGNAIRLAHSHGNDIRFSEALGWLVWNGKRWERDDMGEVMRRAKSTARDLLREARSATDEDRAEALASWFLKSQSVGRLEAMIKLAESEPPIPIRPDELDTDRWLLNCLNGTIDLRTGELLPQERGQLISKISPVAYDRDAECPQWESFLTTIMDHNATLLSFLQRAIGYALTGDTREQVLFILYGKGSNGKSTFLSLVRQVLGDYATHTPTETLLVQREENIRNDLARLQGARFVTAVEASGGRRLSESLIKQMTGGDPVTARFLHREFFEFEPEFKIFLATNHKPVIRETDHAIWRRIRLVPFTVTIPDEQQDQTLPDKLRSELPGILGWAVRGCLEWQREGLGVPETVKAATSSYRAEMDILGDFLEECCETNPDAESQSSILYKRYTEWCQKAGEKPMSQKSFSLQLLERGFEKGKDGHGRRIWKGIGVLLE